MDLYFYDLVQFENLLYFLLLCFNIHFCFYCNKIYNHRVFFISVVLINLCPAVNLIVTYSLVFWSQFSGAISFRTVDSEAA